MSSAVTLLQLALSLLIAAQQPNVPENLKVQAIQTANIAISYAQSELHISAVNTPIVIASVPPVSAPPKAPLVSLIVGGKEGKIEATHNRTCQGREAGTSSPCWHATVSWETTGFEPYSCFFSDGPSWGSGYWGLSGSKESDFLEGKTIFRLQCKNDQGSFFNEVEINVI